ncbi:MAG: DNA-directed RNA polymerase subunit beta, partial [Victivallales bacterium]|nr:DNA-directed RNA polymerase subunit beta [Victivallales bacterium]
MKGERISFGQLKEVMPIPDLIGIQTKSFAEFLQKDVPADKRRREGLQSVFMDMFPTKEEGSKSYSGIEFVSYEVVEGDRDLPELLKRGRNYQADIYANFRMKGNSSKDIREERIFMGHLPLMTPSGSFIINGSERVIVSQLHRSPGICFERTRHASGKELYSFKIIADHGSWIEVQFDPKDKMNIYLDRKRRRRKFLVSTFLRAFGYNGDAELLDAIYGVQTLSVKELMKLSEDDLARYTVVEAITDPQDPELLLTTPLDPLNNEELRNLHECGIKEIKLVETDEYGDYFVKCLAEERPLNIVTCEDAQREIYHRLRSSAGEATSTAQTAKMHFERLYQDERHYDLGLVGRYKMNQRLGINVPSTVRTLTKEDVAAATRELMKMAKNNIAPDDIDHLSRRRIRTIGELLQKACRVGMNRVAQNAVGRLNNLRNDGSELPPIAKLVNAKQFDNSIQDFFQHNQLSQFMDQTNCLSELTNKRRLSALGPGGLTRDRAGTEVRDVHASHYGRICPIETPEGPNIGLISSLALYAHLDEFGFIETPYCKVKDGKVVTDKKGNPEIVYLKAAEEEEHIIAQANAPRNEDGSFKNERVLGRYQGEAGEFQRDSVEYVDISPKQMISAAASVITFLEHDDANRALMGCNMQRQAVPLMRPERPLVGTGMEGVIASHSHAIQTAARDGIVAWADGFKVIVTPDGKMPEGKTADDFTLSQDAPECQVYILYKFLRSNACTLVNQRPIVVTGQKVTKGQPLADGACTDEGELALGRNVLVAFMSWRGYNFEDAIVISEKLVQDDVYTSVHINLQQVEARESKQG